MERGSDNAAITRLERAASGTFGWQVRLQRRGVRFAKYFADRSYGGPAQSLHAARHWRNAQRSQWENETIARICAPSSRNSSGVVGVSKITVSGPKGWEYAFWQATWCPQPGQRRSVRFSVKRHGEREAFRLAVQARRNGTR